MKRTETGMDILWQGGISVPIPGTLSLDFLRQFRIREVQPLWLGVPRFVLERETASLETGEKFWENVPPEETPWESLFQLLCAALKTARTL